jgi:hypothetical protein
VMWIECGYGGNWGGYPSINKVMTDQRRLQLKRSTVQKGNNCLIFEKTSDNIIQKYAKLTSDQLKYD